MNKIDFRNKISYVGVNRSLGYHFDKDFLGIIYQVPNYINIGYGSIWIL